jgi:hypothetical protein
VNEPDRRQVPSGRSIVIARHRSPAKHLPMEGRIYYQTTRKLSSRVPTCVGGPQGMVEG